jgi:NitT/TauT family transport system permease protein
MTVIESSLPQLAPTHTPSKAWWRSTDVRLFRDRILLLVLLVTAWELIGLFVLDEIWISRPSLVFDRLLELNESGRLWIHVEKTVMAAVFGLLLAFALGVPIGILMARAKYAYAVAEPFVAGLNSLPRVALAPLFIIWFGIDLFSKVMMSFSIVLFVFMLNVHQGLKTVDKDLVDLMKTMKASNAYITRKVLIPWVVPWIFAALRIGTGMALIGAVVGELMAASAGLGWYIQHSAGRLDTTGVFAGITALLFIAVIANAIVSRLEQHFTSWSRA